MRIFHLHSASIPGAVGLLCRFCHIGLVVGRVGRALGQRDQRPGDQIININILVIAPPNDAHRSARNIEQRNVDQKMRHRDSGVGESEGLETEQNDVEVVVPSPRLAQGCRTEAQRLSR